MWKTFVPNIQKLNKLGSVTDKQKYYIWKTSLVPNIQRLNKLGSATDKKKLTDFIAY